MGGRGAKSGAESAKPAAKQAAERPTQKTNRAIDPEVRTARLAASQDIEGKKPYPASRRQVWADITDDEIAEANAVRTDTFIQPGDTFDHLKTGTRIEYSPTFRQGTKVEAVRGTLEDIDGVRVGVGRQNGQYAYTVTELYTGLAVGYGNTKAEALQNSKAAFDRNGGTQRFIEGRARILENMNNRAVRWKNGG